MNVLVLFTERRPVEARRRDVVAIVAAAVPGAAIGLVILAALAKPALQVAVGGAVIVAAGLQLLAERQPAPAGTASASGAYPAGFVAGILTTSTGLNGPPLVLWLMGRQTTPAQVRDTLAASFLALNVVGAVGLTATQGLGAGLDMAIVLVLLPLTILGQLAGRRAFERLDPKRFRAAALALVVAAGAASAVAGAAG